MTNVDRECFYYDKRPPPGKFDTAQITGEQGVGFGFFSGQVSRLSTPQESVNRVDAVRRVG